MNGFYHTDLHEGARHSFGIMCNDVKYRFCKIPMGLGLSPYIMQRVTHKVMLTIIKNLNLNLKCITYINDILVMGEYKELQSLVREI